MSYEGREIHICEKGHLVFVECEYGLDLPGPCHRCGAKTLWWRPIDDTNCEAFGDFPIGFFKVKTGEVTETCPTCDHTKVLYETTYEIPTCPKCGSHEVVSDRHQPNYGGTPFVGNIKCVNCGTILF